MSSPSFTKIPSNSKVYICDFEGWKGRLLSDEGIIVDYAKHYHFTIDKGMPGTPVTIWRWRPRVTDMGCDQRAGWEGPGITKEAQCGDREIRKIFKRAYSPLPGKHFDELGQTSFLTRLSNEQGADFEGDEASVMSDSQNLLPCPHWALAAYPWLFIPRPSSPLLSDSKWVQSMVTITTKELFYREPFSQIQLSRDRRGWDLLGRRRSASPIRSSLRSTVTLPLQCACFVDELRKLGQEFEVINSPWTS